MIATDILLDAFTRVNESLHRTLVDLTPEELHKEPHPPIGWLAWRLSRVMDSNASRLAGREQLWIGDGWEKPVVALSLRYDRIDSFWHTLFHELSHIKHRDSYVLDVDLVGADRCLSNEAVSEIETRANEEAAEMLIPKDKLRSFISRTRPFYYADKINQ